MDHNLQGTTDCVVTKVVRPIEFCGLRMFTRLMDSNMIYLQPNNAKLLQCD